jgi:indoleamine 2,3-dioxygenase
MVNDLAAFQIHPTGGFLSAEEPLERLPSHFDTWERTASLVPVLVGEGRLRATLAGLPCLDLARLETDRQLQRAMLILSVLGNAYVWADRAPATLLPAGIAVPWCAVARRLGRPPIVAHASMVLSNWRLVDKNAPLTPENLSALLLFSGTPDEEWFFMTTAAIEAIGVTALVALVRVQESVAGGRAEDVVECLKTIATVVKEMESVLARMPERCAPRVFYNRIRPFLTGWPEPGLVYEGVSDRPHRWLGGSAAQSSLLPALDAGLTIRHGDPEASMFLREMRGYMPPPHQRFLQTLEAGPSIRQFALERKKSDPTLCDWYNRCIGAVESFRNRHIAIAVEYVLRQAPTPEEALGTGGTSFVRFLTKVRNATAESAIS